MTKNTAAITNIEDAAAARWLATTLKPARARVQATPTEDAIARMRLRVFGEVPARKQRKTIAA